MKTMDSTLNPYFVQYKLEKELGDLIRNSESKDRKGLYSKVYKRYFEELPQNLRLELNTSDNNTLLTKKIEALKPFMRDSNMRFLEIGGGLQNLSIRMCEYAKEVVAIEAIAMDQNKEYPDNLKLILDDSMSYELPDNSIDLAFSSHMIEHLHADDAFAQLKEVYRVLKPESAYMLITPNILYGPHDISRMFNHRKSEGLHIKEYCYKNLTMLMKRSGFVKVLSLNSSDLDSSEHLLNEKLRIERLLFKIPKPLRTYVLKGLNLNKKKPFRLLEQVILVGLK